MRQFVVRETLTVAFSGDWASFLTVVAVIGRGEPVRVGGSAVGVSLAGSVVVDSGLFVRDGVMEAVKVGGGSFVAV